jgi:hypothetical protein
MKHTKGSLREAAEQATKICYSMYGKKWNFDWPYAGSRMEHMWKLNIFKTV